MGEIRVGIDEGIGLFLLESVVVLVVMEVLYGALAPEKKKGGEREWKNAVGNRMLCILLLDWWNGKSLSFYVLKKCVLCLSLFGVCFVCVFLYT
mmetsp:Transcript_33906/g.51110  ORF Transcript_33906/g.51110 Transcript_33906/m.51110 type:complete len:94 (-) Transcript_33906:188-469(-)